MANITIEPEHGHTLDVPGADIEKGEPASYKVAGSHQHAVVVSAEQMGMLAIGRHVHLTTSFVLGHSHTIVVCPS